MEIKEEVKRRFGFTVNIGISSISTSEDGFGFSVNRIGSIHYFRKRFRRNVPLPIGELFMAGRSSVEVFKKLEINTIGDLAHADVNVITLHLKSHGRMLWNFCKWNWRR